MARRRRSRPTQRMRVVLSADRSRFDVSERGAIGVPGDGVPQSPLERHASAKSEFTLGPTGVQLAPRLTVRFGSVPADRAVETCFALDQLDEFADGNLEGGAEIDR